MLTTLLESGSAGLWLGPQSPASTLAIGLLLLMLGPSNILAAINLYKMYAPKAPSVNGGEAPSLKLPSSTTRDALIVHLKQSRFSTPGTLEAAIAGFMQRAPDLPQSLFLEEPRYWLARFDEKKRMTAAASALMLAFAILAVSLTATAPQSSSTDRWMMALVALMCASLAVFSAIRWIWFRRTHQTLLDYAAWREAYGISVELTMLQSMAGRARMHADGIKSE